MIRKVFTQKSLLTVETEKGKKVKAAVEKPAPPPVQNTDESDIAAIAMALYLHFDDRHEVEQTGFWLNRPLNQQTTWTAKDKLFRKLPIRKY